jgi:hypothetical protein
VKLLQFLETQIHTQVRDMTDRFLRVTALTGNLGSNNFYCHQLITVQLATLFWCDHSSIELFQILSTIRQFPTVIATN